MPLTSDGNHPRYFQISHIFLPSRVGRGGERLGNTAGGREEVVREFVGWGEVVITFQTDLALGLFRTKIETLGGRGYGHKKSLDDM